jgi:hypothetical protein
LKTVAKPIARPRTPAVNLGRAVQTGVQLFEIALDITELL